MRLHPCTTTLLLAAACMASCAQTAHRSGTAPAKAAAVPAPHVVRSASPAGTMPVVMLSDLHFDPFQDPAKVLRMQGEPYSDWPSILAEPASATQAADYAKLNGACPLRGSDSSWNLLQSSLKAAHAASPKPVFVTVSGDLVAHEFSCRFHALAPHAKAEEYSDFVAKTTDYVMEQVRQAFAGTPVYFALGNNDSGCGDYLESPDSRYLHSLQAGFSASSGAEMESFLSDASYSVALPAPMVRGRLIVLQDIFLAATYRGCDGKPHPEAGAAQLAWLRKELTAAHERNEQVWVMAHIPPGLDLYNTIARNKDVCAGQAPVSFLGDQKIVDVLTDFAPEVRLAIFGHTHMDEIKLLRVGEAVKEKKDGIAQPAMVAAKLVPSVSPINGNYPAFTVADIDPKTMVMKDYRVMEADNRTGAATQWSEEYRFSTAYERTAFTPQQLAPLLKGFVEDKQSQSPLSNAYEDHFIVRGGLKSMALRFVWPQYACGLENDTAAEYRRCVCAAPKPAEPKPGEAPGAAVKPQGD